jgi:2-hydroxy-3-keto-5-methylthiopentenyl-1-phosphate phosphatase
MPDLAPVVFLDFDGTVSRADVVDALLERFGAPEWRRLEDEWRAGRIGSRACLAAQIACVTASPADMHAAIDAIALDSGFPALLEAAAHHEVPVHIVSDGFDYCIGRMLRRLPPRLMRTIADGVHASHLEPAGAGRWRTSFPFYPDACEHGCATCKPRLMRELTVGDRPSVFVGDGLSDRFAVRAADLVFAKHSLSAYCDRESIVHTRYDDLAIVAADIDRRMRLPQEWPLRAARTGM